MKKALVLGAGGFVGSHMVEELKDEGFFVRAADLKKPEFNDSSADEFFIGDLKSQEFCRNLFEEQFDEIYQFAADMGGAGYIFTGENDASIITNSAQINLSVLNASVETKNDNILFSSSACVYPIHHQLDEMSPLCAEDNAYPANPDSEYGWEKIFSERLYFAYNRNFGLNAKIVRYHNIFGPNSTWIGGKEKAPAAICRKVAEVPEHGGDVEIWGDGKQTRTFLFIDDCIDASKRLMRSNHAGPFNVGSEELISINDLATLVADISGKSINIHNVPGPVGVRGRKSDNRKIKEALNWSPKIDLKTGMAKLYDWVSAQL